MLPIFFFYQQIPDLATATKTGTHFSTKLFPHEGGIDFFSYLSSQYILHDR